MRRASKDRAFAFQPLPVGRTDREVARSLRSFAERERTKRRPWFSSSKFVRSESTVPPSTSPTSPKTTADTDFAAWPSIQPARSGVAATSSVKEPKAKAFKIIKGPPDEVTAVASSRLGVLMGTHAGELFIAAKGALKKASLKAQEPIRAICETAASLTNSRSLRSFGYGLNEYVLHNHRSRHR
jgi:hypothetical protein